MTVRMPQLRPLPRSLAPLPDESLVGFLLRLAHHNNVSPGTIVSRTGMSAHRTALTEHIPSVSSTCKHQNKQPSSPAPPDCTLTKSPTSFSPRSAPATARSTQL